MPRVVVDLLSTLSPSTPPFTPLVFPPPLLSLFLLHPLTVATASAVGVWKVRGQNGRKRKREREREGQREKGGGWDCVFEINHPPRRRRAATCAPTILLKHNVTRNDVKIWRGLGITRTPACIRDADHSLFHPPRPFSFFPPPCLLLSGMNSGSFAGRD